MSPRWLQFFVCYCLRRRHGDPTTKICYIQGEKFLEILSKQDGRRESYFVSCHSDETVYALLEPMPARWSNCCHINSAVQERPTDRLKTNNSNTVSFVADMTYASQNVMPFVSELRATGHGEVWDHTDEKKLQQFGWRCTNTESSYNTSTLIGNWNEQRFDINRISKPKPIPSQVRYIL